jgi:hydrogenase-4 component E
MPHPPSAFDGFANVIAVLVLLAEFGMFKAQLVSSQLRLYAVQSFLVAVLAAAVAATRGVPSLYVLAALSLLLKVVLVPTLMVRSLRRADVDLARVSRSRIPSAALAATAIAAIGFFSIGGLGFRSAALPPAALSVATGTVLVAFVLIIVRTDVVSQAIGFFSVENAISVAGFVVAWGLPILLAVALLFDLLVAVVVIAVVIRMLHARTETLSAEVLDRLRG